MSKSVKFTWQGSNGCVIQQSKTTTTRTHENQYGWYRVEFETPARHPKCSHLMHFTQWVQKVGYCTTTFCTGALFVENLPRLKLRHLLVGLLTAWRDHWKMTQMIQFIAFSRSHSGQLKAKEKKAKPSQEAKRSRHSKNSSKKTGNEQIHTARAGSLLEKQRPQKSLSTEALE